MDANGLVNCLVHYRFLQYLRHRMNSDVSFSDFERQSLKPFARFKEACHGVIFTGNHQPACRCRYLPNSCFNTLFAEALFHDILF